MDTLEERNLAAATRLYGLAGQDWETIATLITDDFFVTEPSTIPYAGIYRGIEGYRELFTAVVGTMNVVGFDLHQMTAGGDWVVVLLDILTSDRDGSEIRVPLAEAMRFRDGLCCEIKPYYFDAALVNRAAQASQPSATTTEAA